MNLREKNPVNFHFLKPLQGGYINTFHVPSAVIVPPCFDQGGVPTLGIFPVQFSFFLSGINSPFPPQKSDPNVDPSPSCTWSTRGVRLVGTIFLFTEKVGVTGHEFGECFSFHFPLLCFFFSTGFKIRFWEQKCPNFGFLPLWKFELQIACLLMPHIHFPFLFLKCPNMTPNFLFERAFRGGSR